MAVPVPGSAWVFVVIEALLVLASVLLVAACGAFVAAEFSLITVDRSAVERAAAGGDRKAAGVLAALRSLSTQLSGAQLGITVTNLAIGFLAEPAVAQLLRGPLAAAGLGGAAVTSVSLTVSLVLATAATMVFGELVPKNLAIARPLGTARAVQGFQRGFTRATGPVIRFLNGTANRIVRRLGFEPTEELASARSPEELTSLVRHSAARGTLPAQTAALLERSLAFSYKRAGDVLTPRTEMVTVPAEEPVSRVIEAARASGFSRFPVTAGDNTDEVLGVVHVKHAVTVDPSQRAGVQVREVMAPAVLVPETVELDPLLAQLRAGGLQLAVVVDEYGGVAGLVTLEDLVEELVGEVRDEHDPTGSRVRRRRDGSWLLSGLLRPDEVTAATDVALPESEDYETVAGLVLERLGRVPAVGDHVHLDGARLTVEAMDGQRIDTIRLERPRRTGAHRLEPATKDGSPT